MYGGGGGGAKNGSGMYGESKAPGGGPGGGGRGGGVGCGSGGRRESRGGGCSGGSGGRGGGWAGGPDPGDGCGTHRSDGVYLPGPGEGSDRGVPASRRGSSCAWRRLLAEEATGGGDVGGGGVGEGEGLTSCRAAELIALLIEANHPWEGGGMFL